MRQPMQIPGRRVASSPWVLAMVVIGGTMVKRTPLADDGIDVPMLWAVGK